MKNRAIRFRLACWYFLVFAAGLLVFSVLAWFAMRASLYGAIDNGLLRRADSLATYLDDISTLPGGQMEEELQEHALPGQGGNLFQVRGSDGRWLFRSSDLAAANTPLPPPGSLREAYFEDRLIDGRPVRLYAESVWIGATRYAIEVAAITIEAATALNSFRLTLLLSAPLLLLSASAGGFWISRRALAPVDQITQAAQRISIENLEQRLQVPHTRDELQRLSETFNEMLSRLGASVRRMTQFTADASHELRTPISLIRTTAEIAVRRDRTAGEYRKALDEILEEAERTSGMLENLMLLARADSGTEGLQRATVDAGAIVQEACVQGEKLARMHGLDFTVRLPETRVAVEANGNAVRRALLILIDNAVKYTPRGGSIKVELSTRQDFAVFSVTDTGIGIAKDEILHIFDRFWRADKARSREQGGAGLGLSIAKWIVEKHDGSIEVETEPGKGSTFSVRVPLGNGLQ